LIFSLTTDLAISEKAHVIYSWANVMRPNDNQIYRNYSLTVILITIPYIQHEFREILLLL